jgi:uncharacterized protein YkwD
VAKKNPTSVVSTKLTEEDRLTLENIELKTAALRGQIRGLEYARQKWKESVEHRYKIKLSDYQINLETGEIARRPQEEKQP